MISKGENDHEIALLSLAVYHHESVLALSENGVRGTRPTCRPLRRKKELLLMMILTMMLMMTVISVTIAMVTHKNRKASERIKSCVWLPF